MDRDKYYEFHSLSDRIRGTIINLTIHLERVMDNYIGNYFCKDKALKKELIELLVADRMQFKDKADAFVQILKKKCIKEGKVFKIEYPGLSTDLENIAKDRNIFAHNMTVPTPHDLDMKIHPAILIKYKDTAKVLRYSNEDINTITDRINKCLLIIDILNGDKPDKAIPSA